MLSEKLETLAVKLEELGHQQKAARVREAVELTKLPEAKDVVDEALKDGLDTQEITTFLLAIFLVG